MKVVKPEDLVIGEVYADVDQDDAVFLRLVEKDGHVLLFKYVSGPDVYTAFEDGLIGFTPLTPFYV